MGIFLFSRGDGFDLPAHIGHKGDKHKKDSRRDRRAYFASEQVQNGGAPHHNHQTGRSQREQPGQNAGEAGQNETGGGEQFSHANENAEPWRNESVHHLDDLGGWGYKEPAVPQKINCQQHLKYPECNVHLLFSLFFNLSVTKMSSGQRKGEATRIDIVEANQLYAELPRPYNSF
jgi:hypothetical protein